MGDEKEVVYRKSMCGGCGGRSGSCRAPVWILLWWESGYGEWDLWEGCCLALMGRRTTSELSIPFTFPPVPTLGSRFPCAGRLHAVSLYGMNHTSQGAGQSFLFIYRCCKESASPFAATDLHSYLMSLCLSTSHWFSFWRQQKLGS